MSDAETDAVATTPRSQYLSGDPDQRSPRDSPYGDPAGLKARAAGWQTPSPLLSPRNLKGAAVAALSPHPGLSPRPGASPRAATPPPQASAAALAAEVLQRSAPQRSRTAARPQSPVGLSAASTAAAAVAGTAAAAGSSQTGQPGLRILRPPSPAPPPPVAAAAAEGAQQPAPADSQASSSNAPQQQQQQQAEAAAVRSPLPRPVTSPFAAASGLTPMSRDASMSINFGVRNSRLQAQSTPKIQAPEASLAIPNTGPAAARRPARAVHLDPLDSSSTSGGSGSSHPLGQAAPTPQPSAALFPPGTRLPIRHAALEARSQAPNMGQLPALGRIANPYGVTLQGASAVPLGEVLELTRYTAASYSNAIRQMALMQASQAASAAVPLPEDAAAAATAAAAAGAPTAEAAPNAAAQSLGPLAGAVLEVCMEEGASLQLTQADSKDTFHINSQVLSPAPTAATASSSNTAGGPSTHVSSAPSSNLGPSASMGAASRCNSLPSLPTLPTIDSVDSFMCPATTLEFVVPAGWRSRSLHRSSSSSCADPSEAPRRTMSNLSASSGGSAHGGQWYGREGGLVSRGSALASSMSIPFKRRSRGSQNGDIADPLTPGNAGGASSSAAAAAASSSGGSSGIGSAASSARRISISSSQLSINLGPTSPTAPSGSVKGTSTEDKLAAKAFRVQAQALARANVGASIAAPARLLSVSTLSRRLSSAEAVAAVAAAAAVPAAAPAAPTSATFSIEVASAGAAAAAAASPTAGTGAAAVTAVRTAVAAVRAVATTVAAAVRRAVSTPMGRRSFMVLSLLVLGGLWALVANIPATTGVSLNIAAGSGAATAAAPGTAAATGYTTAVTTATTATTAPAIPSAAAGSAVTKAATAATAAAAAADAAAATAAAAMAAAGFIAAAPGTGVVAVGYPAVNAYLVAQGAAAVVAGYLDPAVLAAAPAPTAAECAQMAGLPAAELLCM